MKQKMINVPLHDIALHALVAATLKKTHPELFLGESHTSGLGMTYHQAYVARGLRSLQQVQIIANSFNVAKGAEDVITIIRNSVNQGWLNPKFLPKHFDFYTRADQLFLNAVNALVAIQITVQQNPKKVAFLTDIRDNFVNPIKKIMENFIIWTGVNGVKIPKINNLKRGTDNPDITRHAMEFLGLTKPQLMQLAGAQELWEQTVNKITDVFDKSGMYKSQGILSTIIPIIIGVAAVAAPALIFASAGVGGSAAATAATTAATGTTATGAATTGAIATGAGAAGGTSLTTIASTTAAVAGGAKTAASLASGGAKAATGAIKTATTAIKSGGSIASNVADVVRSSGIVKDALPIAQAVLAHQGVNTSSPQTQAALQQAMQQAQDAVNSQLTNGNVTSNPNLQTPASTFSWSKILPLGLSGIAILAEVMKK